MAYPQEGMDQLDAWFRAVNHLASRPMREIKGDDAFALQPALRHAVPREVRTSGIVTLPYIFN